MEVNISRNIENRIDFLYKAKHFNCAQTTLTILSEIFDAEIHHQIIEGAIGLNGAGQYRAQCGLVEGVLVFLGIYGKAKDLTEDRIVVVCNQFAREFEARFGSLSCKDLRPQGFNPNDPPHQCQELTNESLLFAKDFVNEKL